MRFKFLSLFSLFLFPRMKSGYIFFNENIKNTFRKVGSVKNYLALKINSSEILNPQWKISIKFNAT